MDEIEKFIENEFFTKAICVGSDDNLVIVVKSNDITLTAKIKNKISKLFKVKISLITVNLTSSLPVNNIGKIDYNKVLTNNHK